MFLALMCFLGYLSWIKAMAVVLKVLIAKDKTVV